jgi:hypothetical protein
MSSISYTNNLFKSLKIYKMTSNTNNSEKNNNLAAWAEGVSQEFNDDEFFAQHPQPTLEQSRALLLTFANPEEDEEEDLLSIMSDVDVDEDYEDEDEGMYNCADDCCCFRCICQTSLSRAPQICFVPDGEELIGDVDLKEKEKEDQYLYDLKRRDRYPNKNLKTYHEHEPIPMDISDDEYVEQEEQDEDQDEEEEQDEDEEDMCDHGTNCANQVCLDCVWYLEQEALHARKIPTQAAAAASNEEKQLEDLDQGWIINVIMEDPIPMDIDVRPPLKYQRQTSCWEQNGEIIYNGNPDGCRLYRGLEEDDDLSDLPDLLTDAEILAQDLEDDLLEEYQTNMCELHYLEEALDRGENLDRQDALKVMQLRKAIAEYEDR